MSARYFCRAPASVSSWPPVVGSVNSGALSPTASTRKSLGGFENVPAGVRGTDDRVAVLQRAGECLAHREPPRASDGRVAPPQLDYVIRSLTQKDARGRRARHRLGVVSHRK